MADHWEIAIDLLKELRRDHINVSNSLGELKGELLSEVKNLGGEIRHLREVDEKLHHRIDKKDERIRELEKQMHEDEQKFERLTTKIETNSKNNKWWIATACGITMIAATAAAAIAAAIF